MAEWIWAIILVVTLIVEVLTFGLVAIWFAVGAFVAMIISFFDTSVGFNIGFFWAEILTAIGVSFAALFATRPLVKKYFKDKQKTNMDALIGKEVKVRKDITKFEHGEVKLGDIIYTAVCEGDEEINKGEVVKIKEVVGNKIVVKK